MIFNYKGLIVKKIFLLLFIVAIKISADANIESAIVNGNDILIKSALSKQKVCGNDKARYLDLAQERIVYWRNQIELNNINPYIPLKGPLSITAVVFLSAANFSLFMTQGINEDTLKIAIPSAIAILGGVCFCKKAFSEMDKNTQAIQDKYMEAVRIKQILHQS